MIKKLFEWYLPVIVVAFALWVSYGLARLGEPQSKWLWCTMLEVCL